jgi:hypothetical protein
MEQPTDSQGQPAPAAYPYSYPQQPYQQPAYAPPVARPSAWQVLMTFLRLILRRSIYGVMWLLRPFKRYAGFIVIVLALLGVIGWMGSQLWGAKLAEPADPRVPAIAPAPAVENYLTGRKSFDANLMWEAFSNSYQASMLQEGGSKATLDVMARQEKQRGLQYRNVKYIGGIDRDEGGHYYYYSVDLVFPGGSIQVPITFVANREEKIEGIFSPLDQFVQRIMQS